MPIVLRQYQQQAVSDVRSAYASGKRAPLLVMPTGAGKTVCFAHITDSAYRRGKRVYCLTHRSELVDQVSDAMSAFRVGHSVIAASYGGPIAYQPAAQIQVAMVQTLARRLHKLEPPDLLITDEAHHSTASSYLSIYKHWPQAKLLGVTASPMRTDGRGLGAVYDHLILGPTTGELIEAGHLSRYRAFSWPDVDMTGASVQRGEFTAEAIGERMKPAVRGNAISHYRQLADGKRAILFDYSIQESMATAAEFRAAGYNALHFDGGTDRTLRRQIINDYRRGALQVLCNVDLCGEGFDLPAIECVILKRPTASLIVHLQQIGRGLRTFEGKDEAIIIDCVGNLLRHGLPDDPRDWTLADNPNRGKRKAEAPTPSVRVCAHCWATSRMGTRVCGECGTPFPVKERQVEQQDGELVELQRERERREARKAQGSARDLDALVATGMSPARAAHVLAARAEKDALKREAEELAERCRTAAIHISYLPVSAREIAQAKPKALRSLIAILSEALENAADMRQSSEPNVRMARLV